MTIDFLPKDLPARLRAAGLTVIEIDGWQTRTRPPETGNFTPVGMLNHHTGSKDVIGDPADDLKYANWLAKVGRSDLPAPLVQLSLSLEAVVYVLAAGRCNHAGAAKASGSVAASSDGNHLYVGMEWMLSGTQEIPQKMYDAGATVNAVILGILGSSVQAVSCHYQTSVTGKWDIGDPNGISIPSVSANKVMDVPKFRRAVQAEVDRLTKPKPPPDPAPDKRGHGWQAGRFTATKTQHDNMFNVLSQECSVFGISEAVGVEIPTGLQAVGGESRIVWDTKIRHLVHDGVIHIPTPLWKRGTSLRHSVELWWALLANNTNPDQTLLALAAHPPAHLHNLLANRAFFRKLAPEVIGLQAKYDPKRTRITMDANRKMQKARQQKYVTQHLVGTGLNLAVPPKPTHGRNTIDLMATTEEHSDLVMFKPLPGYDHTGFYRQP